MKKADRRNLSRPGWRGVAWLAPLLLVPALHAEPLNISQVPLAKASSATVKPNVMFILDDSGSMAWDYLPDYVRDDASDNARPPMCFDAGDDSGGDGNIGGGWDYCKVGDPPYMSPDFNAGYYNPEVVYQAGVNADGSSMGDQSDLTSVKTDPYGQQQRDQLGVAVSARNLINSYPERVYCDAPDASVNDPARCKSNAGLYAGSGTDYAYPGPDFAFGVDASGNRKYRSTAPYYYRILPSYHCKKEFFGSPKVEYLKDCVAASAPTGVYTEPAALQFCQAPANFSTAFSDCQGKYDYDAGYRVPRYLGYVTGASGSNSSATLTITPSGNFGSTNWRIDSIRVVSAGGCIAPSADNLLTGATVADNRGSDVASRVNDRDDNGDPYAISRSANTLTIRGPGVNGCQLTVQATRTGGSNPMTINGVSASSGSFTYSNVATFSGGAVSTMARNGVGKFKRCDITPSADCAGLGAGLFPKAAKRTDCAAAGYCTYAEEARNFGNWYAYYRTRMQSMKSAAGLAFKGLEADGVSNYRVGFMTIKASSANAGSEYLKIGDFVSPQKDSWYSRVYGTQAGSGTPLRSALSKAGRIFAGKNPLGLAVTDDPVQYSCQQNFAILTTDGYWNSDGVTDVRKVDGGNMDNPDANPAEGKTSKFYDGEPPSKTCGDMDSARSCGTLADVAYHYYSTDLRDSLLNNCSGTPVGGQALDVCADNVAGAGDDKQKQQHMTTYTLGLGVDGTLRYQEDYKTATSGDYAQINAGSGGITWPAPKNTHPTGVDDLWHAAVNGRGQYFSAKSPAVLTKNLSDALTSIKVQLGAGSAAATSNLEPVGGDNFSYVASYTTFDWYGNLEQRTVDTGTGATGEQALWCVENIAADVGKGTTACAGTLRAKVGTTTDTRTIQLFDASAPNKLRPFAWASLSVAEKAGFDPTVLSQYTTLAAGSKPEATGASLLAYLRGQTGFEDEASNAHRIYRDRKATLGDAVGSQPLFVRRAGFSYTDVGYSAFKATTATRAGTVYLGANDGMLHAFDADNGNERWAYVPAPMLPKMKHLADFNYGNNHEYFVDGPAAVSDACLASCNAVPVWATVLVGAYGGGGRGYYALDVTDPTNPKGLWELSAVDDGEIGFTFGNPIVTKRDDGKWVVLFSSGYNNSSGQGVLFVVDLATGAILQKIATGEGSSAAGLQQGGLGKIEAFIDKAIENNTTHHVYAGDLLGNVWRFLIDAGAETVVKVAVVKDADGNVQPITTKPVVTELDTAEKTRFVVVATGKLIEDADLSDDQGQSLYSFSEVYDDNGNLTVGSCPGCTLGAREQLTEQHLVDDGKDSIGRPKRKTSGVETVPPASQKVAGCFADLPLSGERVNVDMKLTLGNLAAISNIPKADACNAGGQSYITFFNYKTCKVETSYLIGDALAVGMVVMKLAGGYVVTATLSNDPTPKLVGAVPPPPEAQNFQGRRVGWRLLYD